MSNEVKPEEIIARSAISSNNITRAIADKDSLIESLISQLVAAQKEISVLKDQLVSCKAPE